MKCPNCKSALERRDIKAVYLWEAPEKTGRENKVPIDSYAFVCNKCGVILGCGVYAC